MAEETFRFNVLNPQATATILFRGIYMLCLNDANQCEVLRVNDGEHLPKFRIRKIQGGQAVVLPTEPFNETSDITISVVDSAKPQVVKYPGGNAPFDRLDPEHDGDLMNFGWIVDLEREIHRVSQPLTINPVSPTGHKLGPKILVKEGTIYTARRGEKVMQLSAVGVNPQPFGKIGEIPAIDITTPANIELTDRAGNRLVLPFEAGTRHEIIFDNECSEGGPFLENTEKGDLDPYYDFIQPPQGVKFELSTFAPLPLSPCPQLCVTIGLGVTRSLPDPVEE